MSEDITASVVADEKTVTHRCYVSGEDAHYGGGLVAASYVLGRFGDVATELCIRRDGDEGLLASYGDVQLLSPVREGDVLEVIGATTRVGNRSRDINFVASVVCRRNGAGPSSNSVLAEPICVATARATVVVPGLDH
jgi:3-aminobutyryl-CoA ammonia-lyase